VPGVWQHALVDAKTAKVILSFEQPYANHNGGGLVFGDDGYLYIATGDGGKANDPHGNGQSLKTLLGKILRIDVDHASKGQVYNIPKDNPFQSGAQRRPEIWAYGLRNPWRFFYDSVDKRWWAADVGQDRYEEIDILRSGKNYGWRVMEGKHCFRPTQGCHPEKFEPPVFEYGRKEGQSVTGGVVYRGKRVPSLVGYYVFADFVSGKVWALRVHNGRTEQHVIAQTNINIAAFGRDPAGEVYLCAFDGHIHTLH